MTNLAQDLRHDLRYALRQLRRSPGFFAVATLLIAAGVAANTQIFTLVNALLLRPLPVRDPSNLVQIFNIRPRMPRSEYFFYRFYKQFTSSSTTLFKAEGQMENTVALEHGTRAERVHAYGVTGNFFTDLGVRPVLGRVLTAGDDHVAVLSYFYWSRSFGRDPGVLGQTVRLKGHPFTIIGVTSPEWTGTNVDSSPDLWFPFANSLDFSTEPHPSLDNFITEVIARLRPGVSSAQAEQEAAAFWTRYLRELSADDPGNYRIFDAGRLEVQSIAHGLSPIRDHSRAALILLLSGTGVLLLMVCANVGGLLLARATAREKETAVRLAIGASRGRIVRQYLTESLLLTAAGGAAGIVLAYATMPLLLRYMPPARGIGVDPAEIRTLTLDLHPDLRVLAFSLALCFFTVILCAFAPAWRSSRRDPSNALRSTMGDPRNRIFQSVLCAFQIALCSLLLVSAGLMIRSLSKLRAADPGFASDRVAVFSIDPQIRGYSSQQAWSLRQRLLTRVKALPGVEGAAIAERALMRGIGLGTAIVFPGQKGDGIMNTSVNSVTPDYFSVMGIRRLSGRGFTDADIAEEGKPARVIVNEAFVQRFLNGGNPLGRQFAHGKQFVQPHYEVIGVVTNSKYRSLREIPPPILYSYQFGPKAYPDTFILHVRTHGDPHAVIQPVRELLQSIDPEVPLYHVATLSEEVDVSLWQERLLVALASCFGVFALLLSAIGLYGIVAYFVAQRRREIGLRMALGAQPAQVIWLIVRRVVPILSAGLAAGAALALVTGASVRSLLYGVQPFDPLSASLALLLLLVIGLSAAAFPALRASRVDPSSTLRQE